jgi:hypothetical protein
MSTEYVTHKRRMPDGTEVTEMFVPTGPTVNGITPLAVPGTDPPVTALLVDHAVAWQDKPCKSTRR